MNALKIAYKAFIVIGLILAAVNITIMLTRPAVPQPKPESRCVLQQPGNELVVTGVVTGAPTNWDGKIDCAIFVDGHAVLIVGSEGKLQ